MKMDGLGFIDSINDYYEKKSDEDTEVICEEADEFREFIIEAIDLMGKKYPKAYRAFKDCLSKFDFTE